MVKILEPEKPSSVGGAVRQTGNTAVAVIPTALGVALGLGFVGLIVAGARKLYNDRKSAAQNSGNAGQAPVLSFFGRRGA